MNSDYTDKDGFEMIKRAEKCDMFQIPSELFAHNRGVEIRLVHIAYDHTHTKSVYFVDGDNGDSYGQFNTIEKARVKFAQMIKLTEKERGVFDE